jgi:hypothetical protein
MLPKHAVSLQGERGELQWKDRKHQGIQDFVRVHKFGIIIIVISGSPA